MCHGTARRQRYTKPILNPIQHAEPRRGVLTSGMPGQGPRAAHDGRSAPLNRDKQRWKHNLRHSVEVIKKRLWPFDNDDIITQRYSFPYFISIGHQQPMKEATTTVQLLHHSPLTCCEDHYTTRTNVVQKWIPRLVFVNICNGLLLFFNWMLTRYECEWYVDAVNFNLSYIEWVSQESVIME